MSVNYFSQLCGFYGEESNKRQAYMREMRDFVSRLKTVFLEESKVPKDKLFLFKPSQNFEIPEYGAPNLGSPHDVEVDLEAREFKIGFAINANASNDQIFDRFLLLYVRFKKLEKKIVFGLTDIDESFEFDLEGKDSDPIKAFSKASFDKVFAYMLSDPNVKVFTVKEKRGFNVI